MKKLLTTLTILTLITAPTYAMKAKRTRVDVAPIITTDINRDLLRTLDRTSMVTLVKKLQPTLTDKEINKLNMVKLTNLIVKLVQQLTRAEVALVEPAQQPKPTLTKLPSHLLMQAILPFLPGADMANFEKVRRSFHTLSRNEHSFSITGLVQLYTTPHQRSLNDAFEGAIRAENFDHAFIIHQHIAAKNNGYYQINVSHTDQPYRNYLAYFAKQHVSAIQITDYAPGTDLSWLTMLVATLQSLDLSNCRNITDAGLQHLSGLTNLQSLYLLGCNQITHAGLQHLSGLTNLQTLDLSACSLITDAELQHLTLLTNLQTLHLNTSFTITDAGLQHLSGLTNLQTLDLSWCTQITDAGLQYLSGLTNLQTLDLSICNQITDAGLQYLSGLTNLQTLYLSWCINITDAGIAQLQTQLPNTRIIS